MFLPQLKLKWNPARFSVLGIIYSADLEKNMDLNYNPNIEQIQTLLKNWQGRSLTPLGKMTFFFFFFLSLPNPCNKFIKGLTLLFYKLIWNGKRDKIK